jgi:SAM domain (Sterile alpha motif)
MSSDPYRHHVTPEHEITGDVLLELDLNMLKELDITAFGKRMRIANAINELRRPASVGSSSPSTRFVGQSSYASRNVDESNSAPQSVRGPSNMYSPESISPSLDLSGTPMTDRFSSFTTGVSERLEELPEGSKAMGQGASKNVTSEARNGVCSAFAFWGFVG